ncbi:MAG: ABC transporter ATP-binding protein [Pseudomonadota bacterium]|jgi:putative ABC transport system ATP-binding protein
MDFSPAGDKPPRDDKPVIALQGVHLSLPSQAGLVHILRGVDFVVPAGQSVGIVGPSGSGKSTLMAVMTGLERASQGRVDVAGSSLSTMGEDALALFRRRHAGIVLQAFHLIPTMTALENVAIPLELAGRRDAFTIAKAELAAVGLGHRLSHYPAQLSGGEQQRVALARALAPGPAILFADEPTGNLDSATGAAIIDLLFALHAARTTTLVLITHDVALAERCARIVEMRDGRILADRKAPPAKVAAQ